MNTIISLPEFDEWLSALTDPVGVAAIASRIDRVALGPFGDCRSVGDGVSEMRIHVGPDYRVYFEKRGNVVVLLVVLLLCGGDKFTQRKDIKRAKRLAQEN